MKGMERFFRKLGSVISTHPLPFVLGFIALVGASVALAAGLITLKTQIKDLLPEDNVQARAYTRITDKFSTASMLIVTVEGEDRRSIVDATEALVKRIRGDAGLAPLVKAVNVKIDREFLTRWGFLLMKKDDLAKYEKIFSDVNLLPLIESLNERFEETLGGEDAGAEVDSREEEESMVDLLNRIELFCAALSAALDAKSKPDPDREAAAMADGLLYGEEYTVSPDGRFLIFSIKPDFTLGDRGKLVALSSGVRTLCAGLEKEMPGVRFGTTGDVAQEADEETAIGADTLYPPLIAFFLVFILIVFSYSSVRSILYAIAALVAGIVIDLGIMAVAVGELNMITSSFGALLTGLGIDFGVHVVNRYDEKRAAGLAPREAVTEVLAAIGLPVAIGAVTTAVAFYALLFSATKAFRQFGFVAGTGILTTLISLLVFLPALLSLWPGKPAVSRRKLVSYRFLETLGGRMKRIRWFIIVPVLALAVFCVFTLGGGSFEYDMRKIGPQHTESKTTEDRLNNAFGFSSNVSFASYPDINEARARAREFRELPLVGKVESVGDFIPSAAEQAARLPLIERIHEARRVTGGQRWDAAFAARLAEELQRLEYNVIEITDLAAASLGEDNDILKKRHSLIREMYGADVAAPGKEIFQTVITLLNADPARAAERLTRLDAAFSIRVDERIRAMTGATRRVAFSDLPEAAREMLAAPGLDAFLVMIYPDKNIRDEKGLLEFSSNITKLDPEATGSLQLGVALGREVESEALKSSIVVGILILLIILLSLRKLSTFLLAALNLGLSVFIMMGLYPLFGKYNLVNILAVPLILGIGIDYSIHYIHRFQQGETLAQTERSTGKAILLSGLTTMFGFGSLALAGQFAGIVSLGTILFIGTASCILTSMLFLPAALSLLPAKHTTTKE